ncbi:MAG: hypothetical protein CO189_00195 [candidate division Zixibacteria bacterium CG_4_9_14_3_um_filter_46_8]|nr:MAG: hypothetical protein CO189_00195 [candidate division Zixibacteria bacterium CG_4_9_14_3_um_filter_46_8]
MDIKVFFSSNAVSPRMVEKRGVLVIDVLRATTTLTTALANGAERILPVQSVAQARMEINRYPKGRSLLCGERGFEKLDGFDLGNSPDEYCRETVSGKYLIYTSTNGTKGMAAGSAGQTMILGAFINFPRPADYLYDLACDITIICCGTADAFSLEDAICGGMYVHYLSKNISSITTNDAAEAALALFRRYRESIPQMLEMCENGRQLASLGFRHDVAYSSVVGATGVVPILREKELIRLE